VDWIVSVADAGQKLLAPFSLLLSAWLGYLVYRATKTAPVEAARVAENLRRGSAQEDERARLKFDCLRRIAGHRAISPSPEWLAALNEVFVVFNDAEPVMRELAKFERTIRATGGHRNEELVDLIKAMMNDLRLSRELIDDEFLLRPFGGVAPGV